MDIATQKLFAEVLKDKRNIVAPYSTTAKVKNITNDTIYVVLSGSNITTPIKTTNVSVEVGDTVDVIVSHEDTRITGNRTDVAASSKSTEKMAQAFERSSIEMANKLDIVGNEITAINNTIELLDNEIKIKDSDIEVINSSIINIDSTINTINSNIVTMESDISTQGSKINTIESDISTQGSKINTMESDISTQGSKINTMESDISTQGSKINTINSDINILNSAFTIENGKLTGISEIITNILKSDYVTTDFLNAGVAWIENGKIKESAIGETEIADASITTAKIRELSADVIKAGTLSAERLILTTDEIDPETGKIKKVALITAMNAAAETEEGGLLDGAIISDKTINAGKIDVVDLNAFGATIGNFKIDTSSMYNAKKTLTDPTNGVYIGTDGIALGQGSLLDMTDDSPFRVESDGDFHLGGKASNFINFDPFTGELEINAKTIKIESSDIGDRISTLEQNSEGFTWTIDETAIVSSVNEYYPSTSPTELLGGDWSTNSPTWTEGTYIWMRTKNTNGKGDPSYTKAVCITGNTGETGSSSSIWYSANPPTGATETHDTFEKSSLSGDSSRTPNVGDIIFFNAGPYGNFYAPIDIILDSTNRVGIRSSMTKKIDGADGKGVRSIKEQYYHSTSRTELVGDSWSDTAPTPTVGKYIWTRTVISYTSGNPTTTSAICVTGNDGAEGSDGVSITSVDVEYYKSTSPTSVTGGSWQTTAPTISSGTYLWSRSKITYTSGDPEYTEAYCVSKAMAESIDVEDIRKAIEESSKTATNYMKFKKNGLTIGNVTASKLGRNVLIDLNSVDIRNGSEVLASYGENIVLRHLGKDAFTIKSSTFLTEVDDEGRMLDDVSYEVTTTNSDGTIASVRLDARTSSGRYLQANKLYVWHINKVNRYAIFKTDRDFYATYIYYHPSSPAFLTIENHNNDTITAISSPCSYADGDAALDTTFKGNVWISSNADVSGYMKSIPPLGIGILGGEHLEIDSNEIIAKTDDENPGTLYLNSEDGIVSINNNSNIALRFNNGRIQVRISLYDEYTDWIDIFQYGLRYDEDIGVYWPEWGDLIISSPKNIRLKPTGDVVNTSSFVVPNGSSYIGTNTSGVRRNNFQPCTTNNDCVIGYGSYSANEGVTKIYGKNIKFLSKNFINAERKLKTLWTGAYIMTAPQSCSLSESISNQLNGIVLEWSLYENGTVANGNYVHHFIPKAFVEKHSGADVRLFLGAGYAAYKIIYISNSSITGNIDNDDVSKSYYGLTVINNKFVLRNVYGV